MRRGDEKTALILAWQDELTALGLLPQPEGMPPRKVTSLARAGEPGVRGQGCGTEAAYRRHLRHHELIDEWCAAANRAGWRERHGYGDPVEERPCQCGGTIRRRGERGRWPSACEACKAGRAA